MRILGLTVFILATVAVEACTIANSKTSRPSPKEFVTAAVVSTSTKPDFERDIKPILARCQPCHFPGGKVYDQMPFDKPETVTKLGTKLFTRIKDEKEQQLIRDFLGRP